MNFDFHDEMWRYSIIAIMLAAIAAGLAFWLTSGGGGGLNIP